MTNKRTNNAASRPDQTARTVGLKKRRRFTDRLAREAGGVLGHSEYRQKLRTVESSLGDWAVMRVRPEVLSAIMLLQQQHLEATDKEVSKAEVMSALTLAGLAAVSLHEDFNADAAKHRSETHQSTGKETTK